MLALECHLAEDGFELVIILPPAPRCWVLGREGVFSQALSWASHDGVLMF